MDSIFDSNSMYGQYGGGMTYNNQPVKETQWTNALSPEEERALHQTGSGVSIEIPKEKLWQAKCTHRDPGTKQFTIKKNGDGTVTCLKCGATFHLVDNVKQEDIVKVIGGAIDILQTMKIAYVDMTPEVIQTYFVCLPFLEIAPKLYEAAMKTLNNVGSNMGLTGNYSPTDAFNSLYTAMNNVGGMMNPMMPMGQPMMGMPQMMGVMGQPFMNQPTGPAMYNPMQTGTMGGVVETVANPQPAPPVVNQQPKKEDQVQVTKQFKLD